MPKIRVETHPREDRLADLGVYEWPIWEHEVGEFPWEYDDKEVCYVIQGEAIVTPDEGDPVTIGRSDLVSFPKGMKCTWKIIRTVRKYYMMG